VASAATDFVVTQQGTADENTGSLPFMNYLFLGSHVVVCLGGRRMPDNIKTKWAKHNISRCFPKPEVKWRRIFITLWFLLSVVATITNLVTRIMKTDCG
jgi:hypothetical protein